MGSIQCHSISAIINIYNILYIIQTRNIDIFRPNNSNYFSLVFYLFCIVTNECVVLAFLWRIILFFTNIWKFSFTLWIVLHNTNEIKLDQIEIKSVNNPDWYNLFNLRVKFGPHTSISVCLTHVCLRRGRFV